MSTQGTQATQSGTGAGGTAGPVSISPEVQIQQLQRQVTILTAQLHYLYNRLQLPIDAVFQGRPNDGRTETGMGPIVSPDKSSFV